jgi:ABC-type nickel/cobalt efflux system permease component RcnA
MSGRRVNPLAGLHEMKSIIRRYFPTKYHLLLVSWLLVLLLLPLHAPGHAHETEPPPEDEDLLTSLIETPEATPGFVLIAVLVAGGFGAVHALSPGHGKTVVAAYLIGIRSTARHALFLGAVVTVTHTIGVFLLGIVALFASRYVVPEQLYPWLSAASGGIVFLIGLVMLMSRIRSAFPAAFHSRNRHLDHEHSHNHHLDHDYSHDHCHDHGHSHLPPGADGSPVTWRSLLALGISGGILPCPSALVLLLAAVSLHRVGFGLVLILAFSVGLAAVLTAIGLLFVKARTLLDRLPISGPVMRFLPVATAAVIMVLGFAITTRALAQVASIF